MKNIISLLTAVCLLVSCVEGELPDVYNPLENLMAITFNLVSVEKLSNTTNFSDIRVNFSSNYNELSDAQKGTIVKTFVRHNFQVFFEFDPERNFFVHNNVRTGRTYCYDFTFIDNEDNPTEKTRICVDVD